MAQGSAEPPFLRVGTEVSAKYRGAFCEASIKTIKKHVKCKIQYKDNTTATLTDDVVKGDLKVGSKVEVKTLDGRLMDGVIIKLTDASTYTVVFDDGDERTLRRSSLCLKGERHFNESETLDHLPLTDPENFGTPVMQNGKKRKKRRPSLQQPSFDDGDSEKEDTNSPIPSKKKCLYNDSIVGKIVVVERGAKRKSHWFPALGVSPSPENVVHIKSKDHCLVRSFKDGNYHVINIRDTKDFSKDQEPVSSAVKSDSRTNKPGIERAVAYLETGRVPSTWEGSKSEVITYDDTDDEAKKPVLRLTKATSSGDDNDESSGDDTERGAFAEKLQAFMEKQGTPIIRNPVLGNQDLDLHKLYLFVAEAGGMEEVTKKQEWRNIYSKMGIAIMPPSASHHIKMAYKKYLHPFELHEINCGTSKDSDDEKPADMTKRVRNSLGRTRHERNSKSRVIEKSDKTPDKRTKPVSGQVAEKPAASKPSSLSNKPRRSSTPSKPKQSVPSPTTNKPTSKPALPVSPPPKPTSKPALPVSPPPKPTSKPALPVSPPPKPTSKPALPVSPPPKPTSKPALPVSPPPKPTSKPALAVSPPPKPTSKPALPVSPPPKPTSKPALPVSPPKPTSKPALPVSPPPKPTSKPALPVSPPPKPNKLPLPCTFSTLSCKQATTPTGKTKALLSKQSSKSSTPDSSKDILDDTESQEMKIENESESESKNGAEVNNMLKQDDEHLDARSYRREDSLESDVDVDEEVTSPDSELAVDVVNSPSGCMSDTSESKSDTRSDFGTDEPIVCDVGDKIQVKYGRGRNRRIYEAKIQTIDPDAEEGLLYLIHYTGWNIRYDEWISPDRILRKSDKLSKKKGGNFKEYPRSKLPPKPLGKQFVRSLSKRGTKSPSPASPGSKPSDTKVSHSNGNKATQRASSPLQQVDSPSSDKPAPKNDTSTRRTRSDRNSFSSNGLDEAVKSPPSKRRLQSPTPEPPEVTTPSDKPTENTTTPSVEETQPKSESDDESGESSSMKIEFKIKIENPHNDLGDTDLPENIKAEPKPMELVKSNEKNNVNTKHNPWSKHPNGLISYSSSESGSPENSASENDVEPASKKIKVEKELGKDEINDLLCTDVEGRAPIAAPHSEGSCTSDDQRVTASPDQEDRQKNSAPEDTEQDADSSGNKDGDKSNSSGSEGNKEEKSSHTEDKTEKKDDDHRAKRHRKKKERKRSRHHSVNETSNDQSSSNVADSPSSKGSPTRPKICFSADLELIKSMEDGSERIRLLQMKINEMRKLYGSLKAEVASIDRKRKKLKKKREENAGSSGHDNKSTSNCVANSPATVECR